MIDYFIFGLTVSFVLVFGFAYLSALKGDD